MNLLGQSALFIWLPIVVGLFAALPPKRAVVAAFISAWLALPNVEFNLPGIPNYSKMSATVIGVMLCTFLFDMGRLFSIRFRWFDAPILIWCTIPFITAITPDNFNDLGPYEGISSSIEQVFSWGLPYLIGRIYLTDLDALRDLSLGIVIGGLIYIPFCLVEIRLSPQFGNWVYGIPYYEGTRFGGFRPKVFLATGLELGLWMGLTSLVGYQLWACSAVKILRSVPFGWLSLALIVTTVLCKSTGSILLMVWGITTLILVRITRRSWPIWILLMIPPFYVTTRALNLWSGQVVVDVASATVGADRAESFQYRLNMENRLAAHALERPFFGWGRFNRSNLVNADGQKATVQDGYWILMLGVYGMIQMVNLLVLMLLPMILTLRRFPVAKWSDPQIGPAVGLSLMLVMTMIDFLSNAMFNPIFVVTIGALLGQIPVRTSGGLQESEGSLALGSNLMADGHPLEAAEEFHRAILLVSDGEDIHGRQIHAEALDGMGHSLMTLGRFDEAEHAWRDALLVRDWLAAHAPDASRFRDLAVARESLARLLVETGRSYEAVEERQIALNLWDILVAEHPRNADYRDHRIAALNDLAWILATDLTPGIRDAERALMLAKEAVRMSGDHVASWNTLGVALYRAGDWAGAIETLERSALSSGDGKGTAFDHYFIAMAWCRLQHEGHAREWLERGIAWTARHRRGHPELERFRNEAESLFRTEIGPTSLSLT